MGKEEKRQEKKRFGSFIVEPIYVKKKLLSYEVTSVSRNFYTRFGVSTTMYTVFHQYYDNAEMADYLEMVCNMMYQMTMIIPDEEFMVGYISLMNKLYQKIGNIYKKSEGGKPEDDTDMRVTAAVMDIDRLSGSTIYADAMKAVREEEERLKSVN